MKKKRIIKSGNIGVPPGTLRSRKGADAGPVCISVFEYDESDYSERELTSIEELDTSRFRRNTWINVDGIHNTEVLERTGEKFNIHHLVLEDIQNTGQRSKIEYLGKYVFISLKMLRWDESGDIDSEQVSIILGKRLVLSFQERKGDVFNPIRERIRQMQGRVRKSGADYLAYSLIDAVVDNYYIILEKLEEQINVVEDDVMTTAKRAALISLQALRRRILFLRRAAWPLRELAGGLEKEDTDLIDKGIKPYLRDLYEHIVHIIDTVDTFRDLIGGLHDIYLSAVSNSMNVVMKVLTIIATIFIPLTFIAGIYGMNFKYMPELTFRWAYPAVIAIMLAIALGMILFFKKKKWL